MLGTAALSGPITLREDRYLALIKAPGTLFARVSSPSHLAPISRSVSLSQSTRSPPVNGFYMLPTDHRQLYLRIYLRIGHPVLENSSIFRGAVACFNLSTMDEHVILSHDPALLSIRDFWRIRSS